VRSWRRPSDDEAQDPGPPGAGRLLDQSGAVDSEGLVPTLSFRVEFPAPGLNRLFNRNATVQSYRNGLPAEVRPGFRDVSATLRTPPRAR
jgi:hypothetical protein